MSCRETPKWLEQRVPLTCSTLKCVFPNFSRNFSQTEPFWDVILKPTQGHQITLSTEGDRGVIPAPACLLIHRGLRHANQNLSISEFMLVLITLKQQHLLNQSCGQNPTKAPCVSSWFFSRHSCLPDECLHFPHRPNPADLRACKPSPCPVIPSHTLCFCFRFAFALRFCRMLNYRHSLKKSKPPPKLHGLLKYVCH